MISRTGLVLGVVLIAAVKLAFTLKCYENNCWCDKDDGWNGWEHLRNVDKNKCRCDHAGVGIEVDCVVDFCHELSLFRSTGQVETRGCADGFGWEGAPKNHRYCEVADNEDNETCYGNYDLSNGGFKNDLPAKNSSSV